jgi:exoribonuclease-2
MYQGKIIEYIDQGSFICTLCLQEKGNRLHLLNLSNREVNLAPKRALLVSRSSMDTNSPRGELLNGLKQTEEMRRRLQQQVQVIELWELVKDEKGGFDYKYLAELCFGEHVTDDHVSALVRALFDDKLYFKMKDGWFLPNSEERIEQIVRQREEEAAREENLRQGSKWLTALIADKPVEEPPCRQEIIDLLVELAIYGPEAPHVKYGKELLSRVGISDIGQARGLLVRLGIWEEDENLDLIRLDIKGPFNERVLDAARKLTREEISRSEEEDLRDLNVFTIDGPYTRDFDDALSMEITGEEIQLGVHITDVAGVISPESILDSDASQRGSSLYLPCCQIPMLPHELSQDILSLMQGRDRRAISLLCRFDKTGNLLDYRFTPSLIRVRKRLTYDEVNFLYTEDETLGRLYRISQILHQRRIDQDAMVLSLPELSINIHPDSAISIEMVDQQSPSRNIVAEFMILYNWLAARFCREKGVPILYRGQEAPSERLSIDERGYVYFVFKQRRKLSPLMINTEPRPHKGLGLDVYTNVSSPIRRYSDLVIQRQIRNVLLNRAPAYDVEALEEIRMSLGTLLKDLAIVRRNRTRYWIQKYLLHHVGETFPAIILDVLKNSYRTLLLDVLLVVEMKRQNGQNLAEGQRVMIRIKKSDPWNDILRIEYAGQEAEKAAA